MRPFAYLKNIILFKDRAKLSVKTRTPPTRKPRSTDAVSTNENDDLFAVPSSTNTATLSSPPIAQVISSRIAVPPPAPVTGLPDNTAAIAAISHKQSNAKEKKKFSLFDSDDSDIDELLFGSSKSMLMYFKLSSFIYILYRK